MDADNESLPPDDLCAAHFACFVDMHRHAPRQSDVARERQPEAVQRTVADPAFAYESISSVEQFRRTQTHLLARPGPLFSASGMSRFAVRSHDPIGDFAALGEGGAKSAGLFGARTPILSLDSLEHRVRRSHAASSAAAAPI